MKTEFISFLLQPHNFHIVKNIYRKYTTDIINTAHVLSNLFTPHFTNNVA